jgi:hypothetical protein
VLETCAGGREKAVRRALGKRQCSLKGRGQPQAGGRWVSASIRPTLRAGERLIPLRRALRCHRPLQERIFKRAKFFFPVTLGDGHVSPNG